MKIVGYIVTFNDPEYLDQVLTNFKWLPDKLYVIEGSWRSAQGYANTQLRSGPETYNILDKHVDNKKVFLIQANEDGDRQQRSIAIERAKEDGADWIWTVDSDEVYDHKTLRSIKTVLERTKDPEVIGYRLKSYNFINSFNKWYDGDYFRIYRAHPDLHLYTHNDAFIDTVPLEKQRVGRMLPDLRFYHYSYAKRDPEPYLRKMHYVQTEDPSFRHRMAKHFGNTGHYYTIPRNLKIWDFKGKHPAIMRHNQNFVDNIYNDGEIRYQSV